MYADKLRPHEVDNKRIVISTYQSLLNMDDDWFNSFNCVIVDEVHQYDSPTLKRMMEKTTKVKNKIGLTGSVKSGTLSKLTLKGLFGRHRKLISIEEAQDKKIIRKFEIKILILKHDPIQWKMDYPTEKQFLFDADRRNDYIKNLLLSLKGNTINLFDKVDGHILPFHKYLQDHMPPDRDLHLVYGGVETDERNEIRALTEGAENVIINATYGTFSTGINIKRIRNIVLSSPTKSKIRILQTFGRALRISEDYDIATMYDIADDLRTTNFGNNITLNHLLERVKLYNQENFPYKIYNIALNRKG